MTAKSLERRDERAAAVDVTGQQVAAVYAKALLGAAQNAGQLDGVLEELDSLVTDVLDKFPQLSPVFASGLIAFDEKVALIDRLFAGRASGLFLNFLKVLAEHGRLALVREVRRVAHTLYDVMRGRVLVGVSTATPLEDEQATRLAERLRGVLGFEPRLERKVDPRLIGGVVLRVGDKIFDGSVATRLARVREQIIERSVHEIQRGRDRFRHPE